MEIDFLLPNQGMRGLLRHKMKCLYPSKLSIFYPVDVTDEIVICSNQKHYLNLSILHVNATFV